MVLREVYPVLGLSLMSFPWMTLCLTKGSGGGVSGCSRLLLDGPHMHTVLVDGRRVEYPEYPLENGWRIWGMTARILARILNLYRRRVL